MGPAEEHLAAFARIVLETASLEIMPDAERAEAADVARRVLQETEAGPIAEDHYKLLIATLTRAFFALDDAVQADLEAALRGPDSSPLRLVDADD